MAVSNGAVFKPSFAVQGKKDIQEWVYESIRIGSEGQAEIVDFLAGLDPVKDLQTIECIAEILVAHVGITGQAPCGINHDTASVIAASCKRDTRLLKSFARAIAHFMSDKSTERYIKNGMVEIINILNFLSWQLNAKPHFAQLLSEELEPEELLAGLKECIAIYADGFKLFCKMYLAGPIEVDDYMDSDLVLLKDAGIILRGYAKSWYYIEKDGKFIGIVRLDYSKEGHRIDLLIHIFNKADTDKGIGTSIVEWAVNSMSKAKGINQITLFCPAALAHINLMLSCKKRGIFDSVEVITSPNMKTTFISVNNPAWREISSSTEAMEMHKEGENLFVKGVIKTDLPKSSSSGKDITFAGLGPDFHKQPMPIMWQNSESGIFTTWNKAYRANQGSGLHGDSKLLHRNIELLLHFLNQEGLADKGPAIMLNLGSGHCPINDFTAKDITVINIDFDNSRVNPSPEHEAANIGAKYLSCDIGDLSSMRNTILSEYKKPIKAILLSTDMIKWLKDYILLSDPIHAQKLGLPALERSRRLKEFFSTIWGMLDNEDAFLIATEPGCEKFFEYLGLFAEGLSQVIAIGEKPYDYKNAKAIVLCKSTKPSKSSSAGTVQSPGSLINNANKTLAAILQAA